jgi:hypothetical protein
MLRMGCGTRAVRRCLRTQICRKQEFGVPTAMPFHPQVQTLYSKIVNYPLETINPLIAGQNVCHVIERKTSLSCENLDFCGLPLKAIAPSIKPDNAWTEPRQISPSKTSSRFFSTTLVSGISTPSTFENGENVTSKPEQSNKTSKGVNKCSCWTDQVSGNLLFTRKLQLMQLHIPDADCRAPALGGSVRQHGPAGDSFSALETVA